MAVVGMAVSHVRAAGPLNEAARTRLWRAVGDGRDGGDSAPPGITNSTELADLVDSFYEEERHAEVREENMNGAHDWVQENGWWSVRKKNSRSSGDWKGSLEAVLAESRADPVAERVRVEAERAVRAVGTAGDGFKKKVAGVLRKKGRDAGLCRSSWASSEGIQAGHHEYIDVIAGGGVRYILEIHLAAEFEIARPAGDYVELLQALPAVLVGRPDTLERVVKVMCVVVKESMKRAGMHVPPWRREEYVRAKWFSPYQRTITTPKYSIVAEEVL